MNRRNFIATTGAAVLVAGLVEVRSDEFNSPIVTVDPTAPKPDVEIQMPPGLTAMEQSMYKEIQQDFYVCIPSRKVLRHKPIHVEQLAACKSLAYKDLIRMDVNFEQHDYVFYAKG